MATNPSLWPDSSPRVESQKGDDRDTSSGEWVDKVMVNKQEMNGLDNQLRHWQANNGSLPEFFYQSYLPDMKSLSGQQYSRREGYQYENGTTDDELEVATSDSSEAADVLSTFSFPKYSSAPTGGGSKIKKSHLKPSKSPDLRNSSPANGLSQPRKLANGGGQSFNKRQPVSNNIDGKRNGKAGGGK